METREPSYMMVKIPNSFFQKFNPYSDTIYGDWLERGSWSHTGNVYLEGKPLKEVPTLDSLVLSDIISHFGLPK